MLKSIAYRVGPWTFAPSAHELRSGDARVRLERRASATLSLLCERSGEVVSRDEIVERAWARRHLSPNSVAVVIGDLRRALAIPAGEPGSIETVPKAGYRLTGSAAAAETPAKRRPRLLYALLLILAAAALALLAWRAVPARPVAALGAIENAMGTDRHAALMQACNETVLVELGRHTGTLRIVDQPKPGARPDYVLQQRWVLWSGDPELVLIARDRAGQTVWTGAVYGPESSFPAKIAQRVRAFAQVAAKGG